VQPTLERTILLELNRHVEDPAEYDSVDELDDEPDEYVNWSAEWWLEGSSSSTMHGELDLQELVDGITSDLAGRGDCYTFRLNWTLGGEPPADGTVEDAIAEIGVVLPDRWPPA
jgi:hypothetical protein